MQLLRRNIDLILILLVGFILRFTISYKHSYTNDELSAINRLRYDNLHDLLESGVKTGDMHPAGVQVFMKAWSSVFGTSELALRFPFVICGVLSIFVLFRLGEAWFSRRTGIFAAALLSVLYFPIIHAELARPYSPGLLIALLTAWYFYKVLFVEGKKYRSAVFLGLCFAAAMYTHYFLFLFVGFIGFTGLFFLRKENFKAYLLAGVLGVLLFLPHVPITQFHLNVGGLGWLGPPNATFLFELIFYIFNESLVMLLVVLFFVLVSFASSAPFEVFKNRYFLLSAIWFFGIYVIGHIWSLSTPVLKFPVMLFAIPFLFLLLGAMVSRSGWYKTSLAITCAFGLLSTFVGKDLYGIRHMGYRNTAMHLVEWNKTYGDENIYTVYNLSNPDYMNFYAGQLGDSISFDWDVIEFADSYPIRRDLVKRTEPYCVIGYSERLTLPQVFETVREFYPGIIEGHQFDNSAVFLMSRKEIDKVRGEFHDVLFSAFQQDTAKDRWRYDPAAAWTDSLGRSFYTLNDKIMYGPECVFDKMLLERADPAAEFMKRYIKVVVEADCPETGQLTVSLSAKRDGQQLQHRGENFWMGYDLEEMLVTTKDSSGIGSAYFAFEIPEFIEDTDELSISLWNRNGLPIHVASFRIYLVANGWN